MAAFQGLFSICRSVDLGILVLVGVYDVDLITSDVRAVCFDSGVDGIGL